MRQLRVALRSRHGQNLLQSLHDHITTIPAAVLIADNAARYVAVNAAAVELTGFSHDELLALTVMDLTPVPRTDEGRRLWEAFITQGGQHGEYDLRVKIGAPIRVRYWAYASIAPGYHVSFLLPGSE